MTWMRRLVLVLMSAYLVCWAIGLLPWQLVEVLLAFVTAALAETGERHRWVSDAQGDM